MTHSNQDAQSAGKLTWHEDNRLGSSRFNPQQSHRLENPLNPPPEPLSALSLPGSFFASRINRARHALGVEPDAGVAAGEIDDVHLMPHAAQGRRVLLGCCAFFDFGGAIAATRVRQGEGVGEREFPIDQPNSAR